MRCPFTRSKLNATKYDFRKWAMKNTSMASTRTSRVISNLKTYKYIKMRLLWRLKSRCGSRWWSNMKKTSWKTSMTGDVSFSSRTESLALSPSWKTCLNLLKMKIKRKDSTTTSCSRISSKNWICTQISARLTLFSWTIARKMIRGTRYATTNLCSNLDSQSFLPIRSWRGTRPCSIRQTSTPACGWCPENLKSIMAPLEALSSTSW